MPSSDHTDYMYCVQVRDNVLTQRSQDDDNRDSKDNNTKDITVILFSLEKQTTDKQTKHTNKKFPVQDVTPVLSNVQFITNW